MNPKIALEIFGYIGTFLVILSMTMTSVNKLRIFNICGAVISAIYSAVYQAWPVVLLNVSLTVINLFYLTKGRLSNKNKNDTGTVINESANE